MTVDDAKAGGRHRWWAVLQHKNVLSGLLFIAVALFGLWVSRDYPIGTTLRMSTGYMPRLLLWILLALGMTILLLGVRQADSPTVAAGTRGAAWRAVVFVPLSLVVFGLSLERLGLVVSILLLIGIGAVAARNLRPLETVIAAIVLITLCWLIFTVGLSLTIPVWPEF